MTSSDLLQKLTEWFVQVKATLGRLENTTRFKAFRNRFVPFIITFFGIGAAVLLLLAWNAEIGLPVTCSCLLQTAQPPQFRYVEIELNQQHPIEPSFSGSIFAGIAAPEAKTFTASMDLTILRSAGQGYGRSQYVVHLVPIADGRELIPSRLADFDLVTTGLHRKFPLDSGLFDFILQFQPQVPFDIFRFTNRVPGFVVDCNDIGSQRKMDGSLHIRFKLQRSPLIQLTVFVLTFGSLVFLVLILMLQDIQALATSTASFFFSIWSIRSILGPIVHTFPTFLDLFLLSICIVLIVALSWKVTLRKVH